MDRRVGVHSTVSKPHASSSEESGQSTTTVGGSVRRLAEFTADGSLGQSGGLGRRAQIDLDELAGAGEGDGDLEPAVRGCAADLVAGGHR